MIAFALLTGAAVVALWAGGYLVGARAGRSARAQLRARADEQDRQRRVAETRAMELAQRASVAETRTTELSQRASIAETRAGELAQRASVAEMQATELAQRASATEVMRQELQASLAPLAEQEAEVRRLAEHLQRVAGAVAASGEEQKALKTTFEGVMRPLTARNGEAQKLRTDLEQLLSEKLDAQAGDERLRRVVAEAIRPLQERTRADRLQAVVAEALRPMVDGERLSLDLARLRLGESRKDLTELLTAIAGHGAFATVIISDQQGLLLAANEEARDADVRAGLSALALSLADSYVQSDVPAPLAVLVHDSANQVVLSRLFSVDTHRFLLTAVSKGRFVPPNVLDPALDRIEQLMADWTTTQDRPTEAGH